MTRLKGSAGGSARWLWIILALLILAGLVLLLDYYDVIPLHLY